VRHLKGKRDFLRRAVAAGALALSACAGVEPNAAESFPVRCGLGRDCDKKWRRAAAWVAQNAFYPIETHTDTLIQTFGPTGKSPGMAMRVERLVGPDGSGALALEIRCANILGCVPDVDYLTGSFAAYVSGASSDLVATPPPEKTPRNLPLLGNPLAILP